MLAVIFLLASCSKSDNSAYDPNWTDDNAFARQDNPFNSAYKSNLSSATNSLNSTDAASLNNLVASTDDINPADEISGWTAELEAQAQAIAEEEKKGKDMAMQKMALAQAVVKSCGKQLEKIAPLPGDTLLGSWSGLLCEVPKKKKGVAPAYYYTYRGTKKDKKKMVPGGEMSFEVNMAGPGMLEATGGTTGQIQVRPDGVGIMQNAQPWMGQINDRGGAGRGELVNAKYNNVGKKDEPQWQSCKIKVGLRASANPIPQKYVDSVRLMGACFRRAMILLNPMMDKMFDGMDPNLAYMMKLKMLGVQ